MMQSQFRVVAKVASTRVAAVAMVVLAVEVELVQVQVAQQQLLVLSFLANPVVHRMEPEAVVVVVPAKQDQLEVPEKVVMESHLQSPVLQPFTVAVVVEEAPECVDSAETAVVAQDLSVAHINSHKEQMHSKLLQEQQIPVVAEVERLMAAQAAEVLAEAG